MLKPAPLAIMGLALAGCRPAAGPPLDVVRQHAEVLFERAVKGEKVPVPIRFTGEGPDTPRLLKTEVGRLTTGIGPEGAEVYQYDVRLTYMNRIRQMENAAFRFAFVKKNGVWTPWYPAAARPGK